MNAHDPYIDPDTGILRNLVGARTQAELDRAEADLTAVRAIELIDRPLAPTGDLDELRGIHRALFQDVYDWAGEIRTIDMRKNVDGAELFLPQFQIERAAGFAAGEAPRRQHAPRPEPGPVRGPPGVPLRPVQLHPPGP
ncbi:Fic/DOC family protein (plasmid) [Curtobacterium flaccumfaciens]|nr:hypothetical protein N8D75_17765 [Curtobacterium flaccumfaciens]